MSWKKQGGTNRLDSTSNVNVNSVVANKFTIKDYFYGDMNVLGNINAEGSMKVKGNLLAAYVGAENIFANLTLKVLRNATIYGSMAVKKDMYVYERHILGNIERNNNIITIFNNDSITGNLGITQAKITDSRTGVANLYYDGHIGFGTNNPVATLDITGNIPLTFAVRTDNTQNYSIISRNNEDSGVVAHTDLATTEIQFYKETPIPSGDISGSIPDARVQYIEGGVLAIEAPDSVITYSRSVLTTGDTDLVINNSAQTIYDIPNGPFAYDTYNSSTTTQSNAISMCAPDASSVSMIHFTNTQSNSGISMGGGAYPPNPAKQRMGTIGYTQSDGTYAPAINIVTSANTRLFHRTTVGINTPNPLTDEYVMDVNGPVLIRSTTETNVVQTIPFELQIIKHCQQLPNYIIAVGKPYTIPGDPDTFYTDPLGSTVIKNYQQKVYLSNDKGETWSVNNFNDTDIGLLADNSIHAAYIYDDKLCFVCTQKGFMYYTADNGLNWFGVGGLPFTNNIHSVFVSNHFVSSHSVLRVFVCGNTVCDWFDMPLTLYNNPANFTIFSLNHGTVTFPGVCSNADALHPIMYITAANKIYSYDISNYAGPIKSNVSYTNNSGDIFTGISLATSDVATAVGPGIIVYTTDGGITYDSLLTYTDPFFTGKTFNSIYTQDINTSIVTGYDSNGAFIVYFSNTFQDYYFISDGKLREFGAPPSLVTTTQLYDAFLVSPESIMFYDVTQNYDPNNGNRGKTVIYNMYIPHILTPNGASRTIGNGTALRVDYGAAEFGGTVVAEKDMVVNGTLAATYANLGNTTLTDAVIDGISSISGDLNLLANVTISGDIIADGSTVSPEQIAQLSNITGDIQTQLDNKLSKTEAATVSGQILFSGNNSFSGSNYFSASNQFDNLRVASTGLTTVVSPSVSYTISPTRLSYLSNLVSDVQTQLNDKLSLSAGGGVLNGTYTFNGQINIANTVLVADNTFVNPADLAAMKGATSNFQAQLDVMKIAMDAISGGSSSTIQNAAMVSNVALNTFEVPNRFNKDTTIIGNVIANYATITPTHLSYLSTVTSNIQTQLNNRVSFNATSGIDISGAITANGGLVSTADISANTVKTQYQILGGCIDISANAYTLAATQSGSIVNITSTNATTITLPDPTTLGVWFMIYNSSNNNATLTTTTGLFVPYPESANIILSPDYSVQVRSNGTNWAIVGGTYDCARLSTSNFMNGNIYATGYIASGTNLTVAEKAAIGQSVITNPYYTLDVSGNTRVKGNNTIEGRNLVQGNLDVSGDVLLNNKVDIGGNTFIANSLMIGKYVASPTMSLDISGDAAISRNLHVGASVDVSGSLHSSSIYVDTSANIGGNVSISGEVLMAGNKLTVAGPSLFSSNMGIGKTPANDMLLDVSGSISATTLKLTADPINGFALDMSGNIRAKSLTLTDGVGLPSGGVADSALSSNVALLNRSPQTFSGDNYINYLSVGGATKSTGISTYALDISGGLRVTSGEVVLPDGAITTSNLPASVCLKSGNNLFLVDSVGLTTPYLGIGKGSMQTQHNVDVSGSMNADGPIYAQKIGVNKKGAIASGVDVDISGIAAISNTLNIGKKLNLGSPSIVVASATISKRSGAYDLYWASATASNLSMQLSGAFNTIALNTRIITYTPITTAGTYTFTYTFDYATAITNHPAITIYPNYTSSANPGTGYDIVLPSTSVKSGVYSKTVTLSTGLTTGFMFVDIGTVGPTGTAPTPNLIANTQTILVTTGTTITDANSISPTVSTDAVPMTVNTAAVFNAPTRITGGLYADTSQTIHFGSNAPIMSGSNILPGTIPSTAFATSGVDLGSEQTISGAKTFDNNLTVKNPYKLLVGTSAVSQYRNPLITADINGGIQASKFMTVGSATILNMVSKRPDNVEFNITNTDVFGFSTSAQSERTYNTNPLGAALVNTSNITMPRQFALSGYYTFSMSYSPSVPSNRFASNVVITSIIPNSGTVLATLDLSGGTTASATIYLPTGIQNIQFTAPSTVTVLSITQIEFNIDFRYDNSSAPPEYELAVNGDAAIFGKFTPYFGIDASSTQSINFGSNAPIMSGAGILPGSVADNSLSSNIAKLNVAQTFVAKPKFSAGADVSGIFTADTYNGDGTGLSGLAKLATTNTFTANQIINANLTISGETIINGNLTSTNTTGIMSNSDIRMFDKALYLRTDTNHGMKYERSPVDGVKIFGWAGGVLATTNTASAANILQWTNTNVVLYRPILKDSYALDFGSTLHNIRLGNSSFALSTITGNNNIGLGNSSISGIVTGSGNIGIGSATLSAGTATNSNNVAIGTGALTNSSGNSNTAVGHRAGYGSGSVNMTGSSNTFIGADTGFDTSANSYSNSTAIGAGAKITASNRIVLGTTAETVIIPGNMIVTGTFSLAGGVAVTTIADGASLNIPSAEITSKYVKSKKLLVENTSDTMNGGVYFYSSTVENTTNPYIYISDSNLRCIPNITSSTPAWSILKDGTATFSTKITSPAATYTDVSSSTITSTGLTKANSLAVSTTSTFTGATTHNGGITSTTITSGTIASTGASTLNSLSVTTTAAFTGAATFGGTTSFTGATTHNGGLTASTVTVTGNTTMNGGLTVANGQTVDFGNCTVRMSGANITTNTIPLAAIVGNTSFMLNNAPITMTLSSGLYFKYMKSGSTGYTYINTDGSVGFNTGSGSTTSWSIDSAGVANLASLTTSGNFTGANATITGTSTLKEVAINNGKLSFYTVAPSSGTPTSATLTYDSNLNNLMLGVGNMNYNNANVTGRDNVGIGTNALKTNATGQGNVAVGQSAGGQNTSGSNNTFIGNGADSTTTNYSNSTALGYNAKITGSNQIVLGTATETVMVPGSLDVNGTFAVSVFNSDITANITLTKPLCNVYKVFPPSSTAITITLPTITAEMVGTIIEFRKITNNIGAVINVKPSGNPSASDWIQSGYVVGGGTGVGSVNYAATAILINANMTCGRILCSGIGAWLILNDTETMVNIANDQTIAGVKNFSSPPIMSGASITANSIPTTAINGGVVNTTSAQTIAGVKTFSSNIIVPKVISGDTNIIFTNSGNNPNILNWNTVIGNVAGASLNDSGSTFIGNSAGYSYSSGNNTCVGANSGTTGALNVNTLTGTLNTHLGVSAGTNIRTNSSNNTFLGASTDFSTAATYHNSTAVGYNAKITASNQIVLGTATETVIIPGSLNINTGTLSWSNTHKIKSYTSTVLNNGPVYYWSNNLNALSDNGIIIGVDALKSLTLNSGNNTAIGHNAIKSATQTWASVAVGLAAGSNYTYGGANVFVGSNCMSTPLPSGITACTIDSTTAIGYNSGTNVNVSAVNNTFIGAETGFLTSGVSYNKSTAIGHGAKITASNQIVLGTSGETVNIPGVTYTKDVYLQDSVMYMKSDSNHFIRYNSGVDGVLIQGFKGGALNNGATNRLIWDNSGIIMNGNVKTSNISVISNGATLSNFPKINLINTNYSGYQSDNTQYWTIFMNGSSQGQFAITPSQNLSNQGVYLSWAGTSWSAASDLRLKKNITSIADGLDIITRLRPVEFNYKSDKDSTPLRLGFIAQEVNEVLPRIVSNSTSINESTGESYLGLSTTDMIPHMVKAIQELHEENTKQKSEIADLRSEIAELRSLVQSLLAK